MEAVAIISGVAGMTGSVTAAKLLERGDAVIGFDNFFAGSHDVVTKLLPHEKFHFFEYDINNVTDMDTLFSFLESEYPAQRCRLSFINCAAVVHTKHFYHPDDTFRTNVVAMHDTLRRAIQAGFYLYINCSTSEVYSMRSWQKGGVREDAPVLIATAEQSLRTSYAAGKLLTEFFIRDAVKLGHIKGCSIRFANVYSPNEAHEEHIIPYIIASLSRDRRVVLLENAKETYRTFLHNCDSCSAVIRLLDTPTVLDGTVYNVGTTEEISIIDLVAKIASLMGLTNISIEYHGRRSADPTRRLLNIDKINKATGWVPEISLDAGLRDCIKRRHDGKKST
jgi:dTDP-glucose 4,6-dehydratase